MGYKKKRKKKEVTLAAKFARLASFNFFGRLRRRRRRRRRRRADAEFHPRGRLPRSYVSG